MRTLAEIDHEIATLRARLNDLQLERDDARQHEIVSIIRLFDAGLSQRQIAREFRKGVAEVQGVLYRSGRTEKGRTAIRQHIVAEVAAGMAQ